MKEAVALYLAFDHIAFKALDTLFGTFNDLIIDGDVITSLECRKRWFLGQLLMNKVNCVPYLPFYGRLKGRGSR